MGRPSMPKGLYDLVDTHWCSYLESDARTEIVQDGNDRKTLVIMSVCMYTTLEMDDGSEKSIHFVF